MVKVLLLLVLLPLLPAQVGVQVRKGSDSVQDAVITNVEGFMAGGIRRLRGRFPGTPNRPIRVVVHADAASMAPDVRRLLAYRSPGLALLSKDEIHIVLDHLRYNPPGDLRTVVEHELVHVLLDQHVGREAGPYVPRWFHEGLAQVLSEALYLGIREEDIVWRVQQHTYLSFSELTDGFPSDRDDLSLAYGQSFSFVSFLLREVGLETLLETARSCSRAKSFGVVFLGTTGKALAVYEQGWVNHVVHGSGAPYRYILRNCFLLLLAAALPLLAFAVIRRLRRDDTYRKKLAREDAEDF
jgi:hypothetical protein